MPSPYTPRPQWVDRHGYPTKEYLADVTTAVVDAFEWTPRRSAVGNREAWLTMRMPDDRWVRLTWRVDEANDTASMWIIDWTNPGPYEFDWARSRDRRNDDFVPSPKYVVGLLRDCHEARFEDV